MDLDKYELWVNPKTKETHIYPKGTEPEIRKMYDNTEGRERLIRLEKHTEENIMDKAEFVRRRTRIISNMLDNPDELGIYRTTECFAALDDLFDEIRGGTDNLSEAQKLIRHCCADNCCCEKKCEEV